MSCRAALAIAAGKLSAALLALLGREGTTLPGRIALRVHPRLLRTLGSRLPGGVVLVTGTNGKTTTAAMIAAVASAADRIVAHNRGGANLIPGIVTALVRAWGPRPPEIGVFEVDEGTFPAVCAALAPRLVVVTNVFRDQLDRFGEPSATVARIRQGLASGARPRTILNADDPLVASLGIAPTTEYFGSDIPPALYQAEPSDAPRCPGCRSPLRYHQRTYGHLGLWECPGCGRARPEPSVIVRSLAARGRSSEVDLDTPEGPVRIALRQAGLHNATNAAAAMCAGLALGVDAATAAAAIARAEPAFGRMQWIEVCGHPACVALVKNPIGMGRALEPILTDPAPGKAVVFFLQDQVGDGTDVSWIWDADLDPLALTQDRVGCFVASGLRAEDMALRLKYGGVDAGRIEVVRNPTLALRRAVGRAAPGAPLYLLPTYTGLLRMRAVLARVGWSSPCAR